MNNNRSKDENISLLIQEMNKSGNIQRLLDVGYECLGNPLLLVDISLSFIAHAGGNLVCDEPLWEWTLSKGYVTEEYVNSIMSMTPDLTKENKKLIWEQGMLMHPQLVGLVAQSGTPLGYLKLLAYNHEVSKEDEEFLAVLCDLVAVLLSGGASDRFGSSHPLVESFLIALLNQKLYDPVAIEERAKQFNLKLYENLVIIAVKLSDEIKQLKERIYFLKQKLQNSLNRNTVAVYDGYIVVLYDTKNPEGLTEKELHGLSSIVSPLNCKIGISPVFKSLINVSSAYLKARTSVKISDILEEKDLVNTYDDHVISHMILKYGETGDGSYLIPAAVKKLLLYDKETGSDYVNTLFSFTDHFKNMTETSKALHIHHNTLKYRIDKIIELTGIDLDDPETFFRISLSEKVLKVLKF